ncbi:hypothetical protein [Legionella drancourtii]|nr:hypothetical protein [Legionella drancourtii]
MVITELIQHLQDSGVSLSFFNGTIIAKPKDCLTDSTRNQIIIHKKPLLVYFQVESACKGMNISPSHIINHLLSIEDEADLINGDLPEIALKLHIELWMAKGMPHYSGKPELKIDQGEK